MATGQDNHNGSFSGEMRSLNLDVPEFSGDFRSMNYPQLAQAKRLVENSLDHLFGLLHDTYKFDMTSPLVVNGFPRRDVDVVSVRLIRSNIIRLRNDHSAILGQLQIHLTQQLQASANSSVVGQEKPESGELSTSKNLNLHSEAFAFVNDVTSNSPAEKAGLIIGDRILSFDGDICYWNHNNLTALAARAKAKKDTQVPVEVLRDSNRKTLILVPTENWPGRGLLGCHIIPL
ncbi:hypothetical protein JCM33374_g2763 [Metschnikowia sp. JCM 33374]|nr:hypothetical protein JCM33374_g2763 [Metschnikowia sp. JCM 33374]